MGKRSYDQSSITSYFNPRNIERAYKYTKLAYDITKGYQNNKPKKAFGRRRRMVRKQYGGRRMRTTRFRGSKRQRRVRRVAKLVGYGSKANMTLISSNVAVIASLVNQVHFKISGLSESGINTKFARDEFIPKIQTHFASSTDNEAKVIVKSQSSTVTFKNQSNVQCYVDLYEIKCIRDLPNEYNLDSVLSLGFSAFDLPNSRDQNVGITLFQNANFARFFKVLKKHTFYMDPGMERKKTMFTSAPTIWTEKYRDTTSYTELKGAHRWMFKVQGSLVHDSGVATRIGHAPAHLDVFYNMQIVATVGSQSTSTTDYTQGETPPLIAVQECFRDADEQDGAVAVG